MPVLLALAALAAMAAAQIHIRVEEGEAAGQVETRVRATLAAVEGRERRLVALLDAAAGQVASLPEARDALSGDRAALGRLFQRLESLREGQPERPALAVHAVPLAAVAWSGRVADLRAFEGIAGVRRDVFVLAGSVTTTLVATVPIPGPGGVVLGRATAELPVAVRRNIHNEYLSDLDLFAGGDAAVEVHYVDARYEAEGAHPFAPLAPGLFAHEAVLRAPDGGVLAAVRVSSEGTGEGARLIRQRYRRLISALLCLALLAWTADARPLRLSRRWRLVLGATAARLATLALGPPVPGPASPLLSPDTYASTLPGSPLRLLAAALGLPALDSAAALLDSLLRSPIDLLLTSAWLLLIAGVIVDRALARAPASPSLWRAAASYVLALPLLGAILGWIADTSANSAPDLDSFSLVPATPSHLVLQLSLLLVLAAGAALLTALLSVGGPFPSTARARLAWAALALCVGLGAYRAWPRERLGLPLLPTLLLFALCMGLAGTAARWRPRLREATAGAWANLGLGATVVLALLLHPTLAHFAEKNLRLQIEGDHARLVLNQPRFREYVLAESQRRIDGLNVLEDSPSSPAPQLVEEMAFAVWSSTDLAALGFSSAVEIQDPAGRVLSRFALNLPSLSGPSQPLPPSVEWETERETLPQASGGGRVVHARRLLAYHGEIHGAIHVYVKDDFWNLPFVRGRDPYSVLYRTASRGPARERPVTLLAWDWNRALLFSSADRPPALDPALALRVRQSAGGLWTTLPVDGRPNHLYLFSDAQGIYALAYTKVGVGHFAADLVEAASGLALVFLAGLVGLLLLRTALRRPTLSLPSLARSVSRRFALRLFVAFIALAVAPVVVLQVVVREFVADRLRREAEDDALERAAVAKKAVEDFVFFRRGEAPGSQPGLDAGLVYIASLMRNDLDVFQHGRLLASSKRELYASGLLPSRVSGAVFRSLVLEGQPSAVGTERIGGFSYLVVSVPVRLEASDPGILSIPLALRQREVEAVFEDLDRTIRLASVLFLVAAAVLAHSMARRISGPVRELTDATQRIAHGDLRTRVATASRDELRTLVESFNQMAEDLERQRHDLERSNRLAAWAEVARQVAHEVKNPLTPIQLSAEHLRRVFHDRQVDFAATLESCTDTILKQVRILRGIVTEFSAFARPPAARLTPQDPAAVVAAVLAPYQAALPPGVSLSLEVQENLPPVLADRRLLERAMVNLLENALQAVGERGAIAVRLRAEDERVELEIEDDGPGIHPDLAEKVFEPFFSTKTGGSGLGLALVKKIVEDHGGGVALASQAGRTQARLWLPCRPR